MEKLTPGQVGDLIRNERFLLTVQERTVSGGKIPAIQVALAIEVKRAIATLARTNGKGWRYPLAQMRLAGAIHTYLERTGETVSTYLPEAE